MTRVLIVEDDAVLAALLQEALDDEGYCVQTAPHAAAALTAIVARWPDLMLLDVHLPGMDGWTFLGACRQDAWAVDLPVLLLAAPPPGLAVMSPRLAFLPKPFDLDALAEAVVRLVAGTRAGLTAAGDRRSLAVRTGSSTPIASHSFGPRAWDAVHPGQHGGRRSRGQAAVRV
jgi:DNA-binding response OmpR family regulator